MRIPLRIARTDVQPSLQHYQTYHYLHMFPFFPQTLHLRPKSVHLRRDFFQTRIVLVVDFTVRRRRRSVFAVPFTFAAVMMMSPSRVVLVMHVMLEPKSDDERPHHRVLQRRERSRLHILRAVPLHFFFSSFSAVILVVCVVRLKRVREPLFVRLFSNPFKASLFAISLPRFDLRCRSVAFPKETEERRRER